MLTLRYARTGRKRSVLACISLLLVVVQPMSAFESVTTQFYSRDDITRLYESQDDHSAITTAALLGAGFVDTCVARVTAENIMVDALETDLKKENWPEILATALLD